MQGQPYEPNVRIPYSKWAQHRADNGLIYLAHPITGEVKWLWSRHHDPKTSNDYLVNTVTGDRQWVTPQNEHLCPVKPANAETSSSTASRPEAASTNPFSNASKSPQKAVPKQQGKPANTGYREIAAPSSLGLTADEALMLVPETGRRYIFNKKTKTSRWLPDRPPDTIASEAPSKGLFGRGKNPKPTSSPFDDDDDDEIAAQLKDRFASPGLRAVASSNTHGGRSSGNPSPTQVGQSGASRTSGAVPVQGIRSQVPRVPNSYPPRAGAQRRPHVPPSGPEQNHYRAAVPTYAAEEAARMIQTALRYHIVKRGNVLGKLRILTNVLADVREITTSGKYDMKHLRSIVENRLERRADAPEVQDGAQRLLELEEYLTQQMLKVDAVESAGNQLVRGKRKLSVKVILDLTDEVDVLRKKLKKM